MKLNKDVLVIDDEVAIRRFLRASLPADQYNLIEAATAADGVKQAASARPDLVLLDLGLPDEDGLDVLTTLRGWTDVPIIVLSARGQERDKVSALDLGADDYLTKPFGMPELLARIRVALRHAERRSSPENPVFESGGLKLDLSAHRVFVRGDEIHLTPKEFKILATLARHAGMVVTHKYLLTEVWGPEYESESHYLRVYMAQLRHKIEVEPAAPKILLTESGVGYRLHSDV